MQILDRLDHQLRRRLIIALAGRRTVAINLHVEVKRGMSRIVEPVGLIAKDFRVDAHAIAIIDPYDLGKVAAGAGRWN